MQIKKGITRIVFIFDKIVIKIPNFHTWKQMLNGFLANMNEREFNKINHIGLAKVYFSSIYGFFLIMEKADEIIDIDEYKFRVIINKKYKFDELSDFILSDLKKDNFGYRKNTKTIIKIDYGN